MRFWIPHDIAVDLEVCGNQDVDSLLISLPTNLHSRFRSEAGKSNAGASLAGSCSTSPRRSCRTRLRSSTPPGSTTSCACCSRCSSTSSSRLCWFWKPTSGTATTSRRCSAARWSRRASEATCAAPPSAASDGICKNKECSYISSKSRMYFHLIIVFWLITVLDWL